MLERGARVVERGEVIVERGAVSVELPVVRRGATYARLPPTELRGAGATVVRELPELLERRGWTVTALRPLARDGCRAVTERELYPLRGDDACERPTLLRLGVLTLRLDRGVARPMRVVDGELCEEPDETLRREETPGDERKPRDDDDREGADDRPTDERWLRPTDARWPLAAR